MRFKGKTAVVTGAASGIGVSTARRLASEGATIYATDRNAEGLAAVVASIGPGTMTHTLDVADPASCSELVDRAVKDTGQLDILCNIAGILDFAPFGDLTPERWMRTININLGGVFYMSHAAMPHLVESKGCIVNMASAAGLVGVPYNTVYTAAKHGVVGLTKALALEFADRGVRVNCICPTAVETPMIAAEPPAGIDWPRSCVQHHGLIKAKNASLRIFPTRLHS